MAEGEVHMVRRDVAAATRIETTKRCGNCKDSSPDLRSQNQAPTPRTLQVTQYLEEGNIQEK